MATKEELAQFYLEWRKDPIGTALAYQSRGNVLVDLKASMDAYYLTPAGIEERAIQKADFEERCAKQREQDNGNMLLWTARRWQIEEDCVNEDIGDFVVPEDMTRCTNYLFKEVVDPRGYYEPQFSVGSWDDMIDFLQKQLDCKDEWKHEYAIYDLSKDDFYVPVEIKLRDLLEQS